MKKAVKLFAVVLVCGLFLTGCGGGGGDSSNNSGGPGDNGEGDSNPLSFAFLVAEDTFPSIDNYIHSNVYSVSSYKTYEVLEEYMENFEELLDNSVFRFHEENGPDKFWRYNIQNLEAEVQFNSGNNKIFASLGDPYDLNEDVIQDYFFDEIFDFIAKEGNVTSVSIQTFYSRDISQGYIDYVAELEDSEFTCTTSETGLYTICEKDGDDIEYSWMGHLNFYAYTIRYK
jgi:hypothetical protein